MKILRALLVGCGGMGNVWARALADRNDIEIVGLVDINEGAAVSLADRGHLRVPIHTSLADALGALSVDVVLDTSLPETRCDIVRAALAAGCDVLSEKPLATSVEEARQLLALTEQSGKTHAVMQNRRYLAGTRGMRQLIQEGVIGDVGLICADFFIGVHFGGFRDEMANVLLLDMAIHTFDQARFMTGMNAINAWLWEPYGYGNLSPCGR